MSEYAAFSPKEEFSDLDCLGTIYVNDRADLNVRDAVRDGKGYVLTREPDVIAALDRYVPMERVAISDAEAALAPKQQASSSRRSSSSDSEGAKS